LMAYTTDLITVLKSLFDVVKSSFSEGPMWSELSRVFQAYERLDPRQHFHRRICANFRLDRQISDVESIRHELRELLEGEPLLSSSERNQTGGWNDSPYHDALAGPATPRGYPTTPRGYPTTSRAPATSRAPEDPATSLEDPAAPPEDPAEPPEDLADAEPPQRWWWWHCLFPCLVPIPESP